MATRSATPADSPAAWCAVTQVRGEGRFGVIAALPPDQAAMLAIKNGWTLHYAEREWNINCLAIADQWILAVEMRFPAAAGGLDRGAAFCADTARRVVAAGNFGTQRPYTSSS